MLTTELTLAGARDTIRILDWLKFHGPHAHIMLIANKVPSGICEIGPSDFEAAVERRIDFLLPCEPRVAIASAKQGQSFAQVNQGGRIGEALVDIAQQIWAAEDGEDAARIPRLQPSLLARLNPLRLLRGGYAPSGAARAKTGA